MPLTRVLACSALALALLPLTLAATEPEAMVTPATSASIQVLVRPLATGAPAVAAEGTVDAAHVMPAPRLSQTTASLRADGGIERECRDIANPRAVAAFAARAARVQERRP